MPGLNVNAIRDALDAARVRELHRRMFGQNTKNEE